MFTKLTIKKVVMGATILILANLAQPYVVGLFNRITGRGA